MDPQTKDIVSAFFEAYPKRTYPKGNLLVLADEAPPGVLMLENGVVEQYDISSEGNRITVNIFRAPAFMPMSWALNGTNNRYFYEAATEVVARVAPADAAVRMLQENPHVMLDLLKRVYRGADVLLRRLSLTIGGTARERLAFELLFECYRFGTLNDKLTSITIAQASLASRSGLARETVSRELHKLADDNIVRVERQHLEVDVPALEAMLELT